MDIKGRLAILFGKSAAPPPAPAGSSPLETLRAEVASFGSPGMPFLSKPGSRIPSDDFTPFIVERLTCGDIAPLRVLFRELIAANPGLFIGGGQTPPWTDELIDEVLAAPLGRFVAFDNPRGELELRALMMLARVHGSEGVFLLTKRTLEGVVAAVACFRPRWTPAAIELVDKGNRFIRKMRREAPDYWRDVPLFSPEGAAPIEPPVTPALDWLATLPAGARLFLLSVLDGRPALSSWTMYPGAGDLGLFARRSLPRLIAEGVLAEEHDPATILDLHGPSYLREWCQKHGVPFGEKWKRERLVKALVDVADTVVRENVTDTCVRITASGAERLAGVAEYAASLDRAGKLLAFV